MTETQTLQHRSKSLPAGSSNGKLFKDLIYNYLEYFDATCRSGLFKDRTRVYNLGDDDLAVFELSMKGLYLASKTIPIQEQTTILDDDDPWIKLALRPWSFGDRILCMGYHKFALARYCQALPNNAGI
jgi:hypothetical protein